MIKVSVIVCLFNVENYLDRCLHNLLNQSLRDIELIFIDDASTDNTLKKLYAILNTRKNNNIKIITHSENLGIAASRTEGIKEATGEYIIHCDPDDYVEKDMYETLYAMAKKNKADIVTCSYWIEKDEKIQVSSPHYFPIPQHNLKNGFKNHLYFEGHLWDKLIRRSLIIENNIFPFEGINICEDLNLVVRVFFYAKSLYSVDRPLYHYVIHSKSLSNPCDENKIIVVLENTKRICDFFQQNDYKNYRQFCNHLKFIYKLNSKSYIKDIHIWYNLFKESHNDILTMKFIPLNNRIKLRVGLLNIKLYLLLKKINNFKKCLRYQL